MQGIVLLGIFLRVTPFQGESAISEEQLLQGVEKSLRKYFGKRGERVVQDNLKAVQRGYTEVFEVPREIMLSTAAADERNAGLRVI
jgi:pyruvate-ferredoxin/flavodoxin oxidoreductase